MMQVVDPQAWNQASLAGLGVVSPSWILHGEQCFDSKAKQLNPANKGLDAAKQTLTAAGYKGVGTNLVSPDGKPVSLRLVTSVIMGSGGEYLQSQFNKLGIDATLQNLSTTYG